MSTITEQITAANAAPDFYGERIELLTGPLNHLIEIVNQIESSADAEAEGRRRAGKFTEDYIQQSRKEKVKEDREAIGDAVLKPLGQLFEKAEAQFENANGAIYFPKSSSEDPNDRTVGAIEKQRADADFNAGLTHEQTLEMIQTAVKNNEIDYASRLVERNRIEHFKLPETERAAKVQQIKAEIDTLFGTITNGLPAESKTAIEIFEKTQSAFKAAAKDFYALQTVFDAGQTIYVSESMIKNFDANKFASTEVLGRFQSAAAKSRAARAEIEAA